MSEANDKHLDVVRRSIASSNEQRARDAAANDGPASFSGQSMSSVAFLQSWPTTYPTLTAIHIDPETGEEGKIETKSFAPDSKGAVDWVSVGNWIEKRDGVANLYFLVNQLIAPRNSKAARTDIDRVVAFHVDSDVRPGENQKEGIARIVAMFKAYKIEPSVIVVSGGGAQAFWFLTDPIEIGGDLEKAEDAKLWNLQLERDLQGDRCHNIDRIMRLPGPMNIPNAKKRNKGRKPARAYIDTLCSKVRHV